MPQSQKQAVIEGCHSDAFGGGHFGRDKTYFKVTERFYWNGIMEDIKKYCQSCDKCQRANRQVIHVFQVTYQYQIQIHDCHNGL